MVYVSSTSKKALFLVGSVVIQFWFLHHLYQFFVLYNTPNIRLVHHAEGGSSELAHNMVLEKLATEGANRQDKCLAYFEFLNETAPDFRSIDLKLADLSYEAELDVKSEHEFYEIEYNNLKKLYKTQNKNVEDINSRELLDSINSQLKSNKKIRSQLVSTLGAFRSYFRCENKLSHEQCFDLELRLFPWFTFEAPAFKRWDGTEFSHYPRIQVVEGASVKIEINSKKTSSACFWESFANKFYGKGIVIPINSKDDLKDAFKLIKVFRHLGNTLPIQIAYSSHKFQIDKEDFDTLGSLSRDTIVFTSELDKINKNKQELWLVDLATTISEEYKDMFSKLSVTLLATLFNSFQECIVMNPLSVPFQTLDRLFETEEYNANKLFLFQARQTNKIVSERYHKLIVELAESALESLIFSDHLSLSPLHNKYLDASTPVRSTDDRIFVVDKVAKLEGILNAMMLSVTTKIPGSELLAIGQTLLQDTYGFNELQPGAIGESHNLENPNVLSRQSAHFITPRQLLWISDGFYQCVAPNLELNDELEKLRRDPRRPGIFKDVHDEDTLSKLFEKMIPIKALIIPPVTPPPSTGWKGTDYCDREIYELSYRVKIEDREKDEVVAGTLVKFTPHESAQLEKISEIWRADYEFSKLV